MMTGTVQRRPCCCPMNTEAAGAEGTTMPDLASAALIIQGLNGEHLRGFLPGNDHKQTIAHTVSAQHAWSGHSIGHGAVTHQGIGLYASCRWQEQTKDRALMFVTWREVLEIVERGCADGRREAYEAAFAAFMAWARDAHDYAPGATPPPVDHARYALVTDGIRTTTAAIITHGCEPGTHQLALPL
jgi:hypothetical protein